MFEPNTSSRWMRRVQRAMLAAAMTMPLFQTYTCVEMAQVVAWRAATEVIIPLAQQELEQLIDNAADSANTGGDTSAEEGNATEGFDSEP